MSLLDMKKIREIAKKLDSPELRELYRKQKLANESLDEDIEKLTEEIQDLFKHDRTPDGNNKD